MRPKVGLPPMPRTAASIRRTRRDRRASLPRTWARREWHRTRSRLRRGRLLHTCPPTRQGSLRRGRSRPARVPPNRVRRPDRNGPFPRGSRCTHGYSIAAPTPDGSTPSRTCPKSNMGSEIRLAYQHLSGRRAGLQGLADGGRKSPACIACMALDFRQKPDCEAVSILNGRAGSQRARFVKDDTGPTCARIGSPRSQCGYRLATFGQVAHEALAVANRTEGVDY